jgi:radical SAM protein with 4Fe4S-binding SPASM domain
VIDLSGAKWMNPAVQSPIAPPPDPLSAAERSELLRAPRKGPALPLLLPGKRRLPLADAVRPQDEAAQPIYCVWEITLRCDLACRHCGSRAGAARPDELNTEQALDLVRQIAELGVKEVTLIGGEAYLRPDWLDIVRAIREHGMQCSMTSGGRGFTLERARAAKAAGLAGVSISIDGAEATHDRLRGVRGSYKSALQAMDSARAAGLAVSTNSQINRLSLPELPHMLETLIAHGGHSWQLAITVAMGRAVDEPEVLLQPYDLLTLFPLLDRLKERCDEAGVRMYPGNNIGYFGPTEHKLRGDLAQGHGASCGAGRMTLGIEADGAIKGCPSLPTEAWVGGNIRDASLKDIWQRAEALRYTRDRTVKDLWGYCATCYYADECRAGCTWTGFVLFGKPGNNPYCHHRALEHQRRGLRERVVKVAAAPNLPFDRAEFALLVEPTPGAAAAAKEMP